MSLEFVEPGVDFAVIQLLATLADAPEHQRLGVERRVNAENVEGDAWSRAIVSAADDIAVANEEQQLAFVVVFERGEGVNCTPKRFLSFRIARYLTYNELVEKFGRSFAR
jgi:hypothetical protein